IGDFLYQTEYNIFLSNKISCLLNIFSLKLGHNVCETFQNCTVKSNLNGNKLVNVDNQFEYELILKNSSACTYTLELNKLEKFSLFDSISISISDSSYFYFSFYLNYFLDGCTSLQKLITKFGSNEGFREFINSYPFEQMERDKLFVNKAYLILSALNLHNKSWMFLREQLLT
ncbi:MAG: hypothetical protein KC414_05045, partial [Romboutsia sp.]|nr:hypothetical protein [Romboutsia sp.]